ncbi:MAG: DUF5063 domain-containing protein [Dysgonamonadaceae bacterium]|jgi:hypothetical protein|nr:DUF5063 domain-containing protein [Dysgonamonadaceae bacterium]
MEGVLYSEYTVELTKAALEYCRLMEQVDKYDEAEFIDRTSKILPLLYLKVLLMPEIEEFYESDLEHQVTEDLYAHVVKGVAGLLGDRDLYLETFHPDMPFSDAPIAVTVSENLADIYQDLGNFIGVFQSGVPEIMNDALVDCLQNFNDYWGQKLVNVLRAVHHLRK